MLLKDIPIRRKLMTVILLISGAVLLLTCSTYFAYEFFSFKQTTLRQLSTLGEIIAANSTAALAFESKEDADEILSALKADRHIVAAGLYDKDGNLFSHYPADLALETLPLKPGADGYEFGYERLEGYQGVTQGNRRLGTLYIRSDLGAMYDSFKIYGGTALVIVGVSFLLAYLMSDRLQQGISKPILALAETAKAVSDRSDYSVRATKVGQDELGTLTDAFNHMLTQIQAQDDALTAGKDRFENIVQSMGDAYVSIDKDWHYTLINERAAQLLAKPMETLLTHTIWEVFPENIGTIFETEYRKVMTDRRPSQFETYSPEYDLWLQVRVYPHEEGIAIFYTDITKYKKAEEDIRLFNQKLEVKVTERTAELEIANKELEAFSYSVSHDLRAPLRSIHGYMNIFSEDYFNKVDEEGQKLIRIVINNSRKMGQLIDDLLAFSKLGRKELTKGTVAMREMVENIWDENIKMEDNRSIEVTLLEIPNAFADVITIKQVWTNLISNAIKYTRHKEKAIIEIGSITKDGKMVYYVKDNGAGFSMQFYDKLFGVFQRLHSQKEFEGTGVGLAIVQRIVAKHGGDVWAEAKQGEGATFYFSLEKK